MGTNYDINQQVHPRPGSGAVRDIHQREIARPGPSSEPSRNPTPGVVPTATPGLKQVRRIVGGGLPR
jgi:hypothetical protein